MSRVQQPTDGDKPRSSGRDRRGAQSGSPQAVSRSPQAATAGSQARCRGLSVGRELITAIKEYIAVHNRDPKPFVWTGKANDILQKVIRANRRLSSKNNEALH